SVSRSPRCRRTGPPPARSPMRALDPCRSARRATTRPASAAARRTRAMARAWPALDPCDRFRRATSMPARTSAASPSGPPTAGPSVAMILVRLKRTERSVAAAPRAATCGLRRGGVQRRHHFGGLLFGAERDMLAGRVDRMPPLLLEPLGGAVAGEHLLDDLSPAHAGVVGAEGDLPDLGGVRDDAHLGAPEVIVEQVLEPHPGD